MERSNAFREALQVTLLRARIMADHFHMVQHAGKAVKKMLSYHVTHETGTHMKAHDIFLTH